MSLLSLLSYEKGSPPYSFHLEGNFRYNINLNWRVGLVPRDGSAEAGGGDGCVLPVGAAALDRQLRPPLRVHLRVPGVLRHPPVRHLRRVRPAAEGGLSIYISIYL